MTAPAIEVNNLVKRFGGLTATDDLSFTLAQGEALGLIGPNGAGKTTLFKMITGEETPDEGSFKIGDTVKLAYVDSNDAAVVSRGDEIAVTISTIPSRGVVPDCRETCDQQVLTVCEVN